MPKIPKHPGPRAPSQKFKKLQEQVRQQADTPRLDSATMGTVYDQHGNVVMSTDNSTGVGLGRPLVGFPVVNARPKDWPATSVSADSNGSSMVSLQESTFWRGWETLHVKAAWVHNSSRPAGNYAGEVALTINNVEVYRTFLLTEAPRLDYESRLDVSGIPYGQLVTVRLQARGSTVVTTETVRGCLLTVICAGNGA